MKQCLCPGSWRIGREIFDLLIDVANI